MNIDEINGMEQNSHKNTPGRRSKPRNGQVFGPPEVVFLWAICVWRMNGHPYYNGNPNKIDDHPTFLGTI